MAFGGRFVWRLAILLGFGVIHGLLYRGDILQVLAPLGLTLLLFDKIKSIRALFLLALLCFVQPPLIVRFLAALQGVGWAIASDKDGASRAALAKCRDTAGDDRRDACEVTHSGCDGDAR